MRKLFFLLLLPVFSFTACDFSSGKNIRGNGSISREARSHANFNKVKSHGFFDIYIETSEVFNIEIEGESNLLEYVDTWVEDQTLHIRTRKGYNLRTGKDVNVYITAPDFRQISNSGSGDIESTRRLMINDEIKFQILGSGDIDVDVDAPRVISEVSGSGDVELRGNCRFFQGTVNGSGDISAAELKSEEVKISISGSGNAEVFASIQMDVKVMGSGNVVYEGNPQISQSIMGSGSIRKKN